MRALHVISEPGQRGRRPPAALAGLAEAQAAAGLDVTVVATYREGFNGSVADHLRSRGVSVELVGPAHTSLNLHRGIAPTLRRLMPKHDLVHVHAVWEEIQHRAARIAQQINKPYIMTPHGMLDPWSLKQSWLKKRLYLIARLRRNLQRASAIYYTTETERRLAEPLRLDPPAIVETLGLDLSEFEELPTKGTFRSRYPALGSKPMLLFLSRIHYKKGLDLLIPAFGDVSEVHPDVILVIAGPDSPDHYQATVEQMAAERGLADRVIFTGMLYGRERIEAMVDADLFVLPSYQENFGIVVIESMAAGTPVIISDQVNMCDDVIEGETGAVVPISGGAAKLASEIDRWLADNDLRARTAERCRPFVWDHYDWKKIGERWKSHYERVLSAES